MPNDLIPDHQAISPPGPSHGGRLAQPAPLFVGHSAAARDVRRQIQVAIGGNSAVLLVGAAGTGKRTVAEILQHFAGGHISDFTFISPLEQLGLDQQAELLRDLEHGRLVVGTRLDPDSPEAQARLSPELLRGCSIRIELPSLVERLDDLEALVIGLLHRVATTRPVGAISDEALDCLRSYDWPGNVAELEDVITEALAVGSTTQIERRDLPAQLRQRAPHRSSSTAPDQPFALALAERRAVERVMRLARGNKRMAARLLQISKTTLYRRLREYSLP
ncbi:helix-turn-helix domain-containing protein [Enhygromyxa salina]|uniref:Regulatory protein LuxO n=1 Tax=Enhygromyxa salina TaxID=215803 RepID=A0A2S9XU10_9BACT|nr:helix-turn-helix domain-containing protein [Enhygromyxa salina]PRP96367.1 Regulatory protein LuxO [Enhygromyxa salina]